MTDIIEFLKKEGVSSDLLEGVSAFRAAYPADGEKNEGRVPLTDILYYGKKVWEEALAALLAGKKSSAVRSQSDR